MRYLEQSDSCEQRKRWLSVAEGRGNGELFKDTEFPFCKMSKL